MRSEAAEEEEEGGSLTAIDPGCEAAAVGWRSAVWSHVRRSLQQTLRAVSSHRHTAAQQHVLEEGRSQLPTCPSQNRFRNTYPAPSLFILGFRKASSPLLSGDEGWRQKVFLLLSLLLFFHFYLQHAGCQIGGVCLEMVQIVPDCEPGTQSKTE